MSCQDMDVQGKWGRPAQNLYQILYKYNNVWIVIRCSLDDDGVRRHFAGCGSMAESTDQLGTPVLHGIEGARVH